MIVFQATSHETHDIHDTKQWSSTVTSEEAYMVYCIWRHISSTGGIAPDTIHRSLSLCLFLSRAPTTSSLTVPALMCNTASCMCNIIISRQNYRKQLLTFWKSRMFSALVNNYCIHVVLSVCYTQITRAVSASAPAPTAPHLGTSSGISSPSAQQHAQSRLPPWPRGPKSPSIWYLLYFLLVLFMPSRWVVPPSLSPPFAPVFVSWATWLQQTCFCFLLSPSSTPSDTRIQAHGAQHSLNFAFSYTGCGARAGFRRSQQRSADLWWQEQNSPMGVFLCSYSHTCNVPNSVCLHLHIRIMLMLSVSTLCSIYIYIYTYIYIYIYWVFVTCDHMYHLIMCDAGSLHSMYHNQCIFMPLHYSCYGQVFSALSSLLLRIFLETQEKMYV